MSITSCRTVCLRIERRMPMPVLDGNFEAFVTNLGKYNEGQLVGVVLSITVDIISQKIYKPASIYYSTYSLR